jgi:hypothetical protein
VSSKTETPKEDDDAIVRRLAGLTVIEYEKVRKAEAKSLGGMRTSVLDKLVDAERKEAEKSKEIDDVIEQLEPWERSVDGAELLHDAEEILKRHVILPPGGNIVIPLWAMGSYCMDAWQLFPKMLITSPRKRCGKTVLLEAIECIVFRALVSSNISPSAIFRCIDEWAPTLMIDEADTFTKDNDELNGIMNAGHSKRNAAVIRSEKVGDTFMPRKFSVWCPQVIAGIGEQRGTMHDRSIHIEMRRKMPGESVMKLPVDAFERQVSIRRRFMRWADDNRLKLTPVEPPACGNDRAQDNWLPLFTLAHVVGGDWPQKVKTAYLVFNATVDDESGDAGAMMLHDIKEILDNRTAENIFSEDLVGMLILIEDRPWFEWKRGKPLTQNSLAKMLNPYHVKSEVLRIGGVKKRGYSKSSFTETFARYISGEVQSVATWQKDDKCHTATLQHPPEGHEGEVFPDIAEYVVEL